MKLFGFENQFVAIAFKQPLISKSQETNEILRNSDKESEKNEEFESLAEKVKKIMSD